MNEHLNHEQVALFCENLGMMYQAGISTPEAVRLVAEDSGKGAFANAVEAVSRHIEHGKSLSEALRETGAFPVHVVKMVEAADRAGRLEQTMFTLSDYYLEQMRLQDRLRSALIYPMVLLLLMTGVLLVLTVAVLPIFSNVYMTMAGSITPTSFGYASVAQAVSYIAVALVLVVAVFFLVGACLVYFGRRTTTVSKVLDTLPFTAKASYASALSRVISSLSTYVASGIDTEDALSSITSEIVNKKLRARLDACLKRIHDGESFAQAALAENVLDPLYARMLVNGERSGTYDETLSYLTSLIGEDAARRTDRVVSVIEPACAALLTIAVALSLIAIIIPLMGVLGAIG